MVAAADTAAARFYNEWQDSQGRPRAHYGPLSEAVSELGPDGLASRWSEAGRLLNVDAVTFYLDPGRYRNMPTDFLPRIIPMAHWEAIAAGVEQRVRAINHFLVDLYNGSQDVVPDEVIYSSQYFYPEIQGFRPPRDVFVHIYGIDLVHMGDGRYIVLEDNLRIPSGISYQLKNVGLAAQLFPEFSSGYEILPYEIRDAYLGMFRSLTDNPDPVCVLLTDGKYGSAFFEHRYLSELLDVPLVEGPDLYVGPDGLVYARTLDQDTRVEVVYRRVEDLDLFVPGLREAYLDGKVVLVNGIGTGAADDKLVFLWVPEMIQRYLGEAPVLEQARSYNLADSQSRSYALENLDRLVIKTRQGYGGMGVFVMPDLGDGYKARVAGNLIRNPLMFIAQETLDFSRHMVFNEQARSLEPHHVDLRVFAVQSGDGTVSVFPGGLTRGRPAGEPGNQQFLWWSMQTDLGGQIDSLTASFIYAVRYTYSDTVIHNDNQIRILPRGGEGAGGVRDRNLVDSPGAQR